jgi:predicted PurR-regulated permease PerM
LPTVRHHPATFVVLAAFTGLFLWLTGKWLLLLFAGVLLAVLLRTAADSTSRMTGIPSGWSLILVLALLVGVASLATVLVLPSLAEQVDELSRELPVAARQLTDWMRQFTWGERLLRSFEDEAVPGQVVEPATALASTALSAIIGMVIALFAGLYLAAEPGVYLRGFLHLVPLKHRSRAAEVLQAVTSTLRWWLLGQLLSMVIVGLVMGIGLAIIGVRLAFVLGVLAGLLEFIPIFGPPLAIVPALLLALVESTQQAASVLVLYAVIQTFEGYILTPLVQRRAVHLPPVLTIAAQVILVALVGPLGLLVAVPLAAALLVTVQKLYVQDVLGDPMKSDAD